jgi:CubicO group peptidase (beta-lactamase class C family)
MPVLTQLEETVIQQMARWSVPGLAIGLLHQGQVEMSGYGIASVETVQPVVPETLFQIGSISKVFTTTLVMTLVDEDRLDLDQPVITCLPELPLADPAARQGVTLRHLLTHTGGFVGDRFDDHGSGDGALARAIAALGILRQQTPLGETWTYCNAGFDIAGRCVENR